MTTRARVANAADPEQVRDAGRRESLEEKQRKADLAALMQLPAGRRFLYWLLETCGLYRTSFNTDPLRMALREGERNIGLRLMTALEDADPRHYLTILTELAQEHLDAATTAPRARAETEHDPSDADPVG